MKTVATILVLVAVAAGIALADEPKNHCRDAAMWAEWSALVQKYPDDDELQALHALRIGLCAKVEQGTMDLERGIDLFERFRKWAAENRFLQRREKRKDEL